MKLPAEPWKRLVLAATAAMLAIFLLSWISLWVVPDAWREALNTRAGYLAPFSYLVVAIGMAVGGRVAGMRFVAWAAALTLLMWLATILVLSGVMLPEGARSEVLPISRLLRLNVLSAVLTIVAAAGGAYLGALTEARRLRHVAR